MTPDAGQRQAAVTGPVDAMMQQQQVWVHDEKSGGLKKGTQIVFLKATYTLSTMDKASNEQVIVSSSLHSKRDGKEERHAQAACAY